MNEGGEFADAIEPFLDGADTGTRTSRPGGTASEYLQHQQSSNGDYEAKR